MVCTLIVDIFLFLFIEFFLLKSDLATVNKILVPFLAIRVLNSFDPFAPSLRCDIPHYKPSDTSTKL